MSFLNPFDVETPAGAEGWQETYPYYTHFAEARRESEQSRFWFFDGMHNPEPIFPFDTIMTENWWVACNQMTTRVFLVPPAWGIDHRIVNGYLYISPTTLSDPAVIAERAEYFGRRAGHYFENWDEIYAAWIVKAEDCIERLKALEFTPLPEVEDEAMVTGHRGVYSGYDLLTTYDRLIENLFEMGSYHFEMLNLGYGAYLTFREFCQSAFPGITDQTVARMVAGIDILMFRPDDEVRKLAALAIELGLADAVLDNVAPADALAEIGRRERGDEWLAALEAAKEPWFWYSTGAGYTHTDRAWADDLRLPFNSMRGYIEKLQAGEPVDRPLERILGERERMTTEYGELLTDEDRAAFLELVQLARTVYPYVENHNFYVEHWHHSLFWNKVRELGDLFAARGFLEDREDIFYLHRNEIHSALYDLIISWAAGTDGAGPTHWPPIVARRREIREALKGWTPPPALGVPPEEINEPITIMLWGITQETIDQWLGAGAGANGDGVLRGVAASPGKARGRARVVTAPEHLHEVQTGEILVCRVTAPSWAPVFSRLAAAVSDVGGIMAHTAIVSREYGLPAVVGTGFATQRVQTGQLIEVDGNEGTVRVVEPGVSEPLVAWLDDPAHASAAVLGGKFASLAEMACAGFDVPAGFAVTTAAWRRFVAENGLEEAAAAARAVDPEDLRAVEAAAAGMAEAIEAAPLPADVEAALNGAYARLEELAGPAAPVAVRSSGVAEDLGGASFAGQYETFLWVMGAEQVRRHVRRCWTGLFSAPVLTYRPAGGGAAAGEQGMAVGVQRMVVPRAAGVMFTLDPLNGDRSKIVLEGAWGLGEAVVSGEVTPDRFRVDKVTLELLARELSAKEVECRFDPDAGAVRLVPVEPERQTLACLEDEAVLALAALGKRIERHRRAPVDIEWAVDEGGGLHVLQVRPETVWSRRPKQPVAGAGGTGVQRVLAKFMAGGTQ